MRFARQARIFRGTLDPAAMAGVFLLLLIFVLLNSLIYTPGVLIELAGAAPVSASTILITRAGEVVFDGKTNSAATIEQLRQDLKHSLVPPPYLVQHQPGAPAQLIEQVRALVQIDLPVGANLAGTDNPHVVLAVNFRGQCFFDNQMVSEIQLRAKLAERVAAARKQAKELTLILWEDRATENQAQTRLMQLARQAGIKEVLLAGRTDAWASPAPPPEPKP